MEGSFSKELFGREFVSKILVTFIPEAFIVFLRFKSQSNFAAVITLQSQWLTRAKICLLLMLLVAVCGLWLLSRLLDDCGPTLCYHFGIQTERSSSYVGHLSAVDVNPRR